MSTDAFRCRIALRGGCRAHVCAGTGIGIDRAVAGRNLRTGVGRAFGLGLAALGLPTLGLPTLGLRSAGHGKSHQRENDLFHGSRSFRPILRPVFVQAFNGAQVAAFLPVARVARGWEQAIPLPHPIAALANGALAD
ncbi:hypothetical protein HGI46_06175 [Novosphingobium sp. ERW19]|nr:hypothetical protein [Novosphingobium sp. ERW19]